MVVKKMKEKCKDAARMRREKERIEFSELSKLLPLPSSTTSQLDKASIIRLTSSYLRMRSAFPLGLGGNWGSRKRHSCCSSNQPDSTVSPCSLSSVDSKQYTVESSCTHQEAPLSFERPNRSQSAQIPLRELGSLILQTLDGFVFALHKDGKIMYISETASVQLGLSQIDLTGSSIFEYAHPADHGDIHKLLSLNEADRSSLELETSDHCELSRSFCMRVKCILPKRNAGLVSSGYKTIHCNGYLKVRYQPPTSYDTKCVSAHAQAPSTIDSYNQPHRNSSNWDSYALVAVGHSLLPTATTEYKMSPNSFMFRANLDLKIYVVDSQAAQLIGFEQSDMIDQSLYQFVHLSDVKNLESGHRTLLDKGQLISRYFRLMKRYGGFVWVQAYAILVNNPRSLPKPQHIVAVCYIIGEDLEDNSCLLYDAKEETRPTSEKDVTTDLSSCFADERKRKDHPIDETHKRVHKRTQSSTSDFVALENCVLPKNDLESQTWPRQQVEPLVRSGTSHCSDDVKYMTIGSTRRASDDSCSVVSSIASTNFSSTSPSIEKSRFSHQSNECSDNLYSSVTDSSLVVNCDSSVGPQQAVWAKHASYQSPDEHSQLPTDYCHDSLYSNYVELSSKHETNTWQSFTDNVYHSGGSEPTRSAVENNQDVGTKLDECQPKVHPMDVVSDATDNWYYESSYHQSIHYDVICCNTVPAVEQLPFSQCYTKNSNVDSRLTYSQDMFSSQQVVKPQMIQ